MPKLKQIKEYHLTPSAKYMVFKKYKHDLKELNFQINKHHTIRSTM